MAWNEYDSDLVDALLFLAGYNQRDIAELMYDAMTEGGINHHELIKVARLYDERFGTNSLRRFKNLCMEGEKNGK